MRRFLPALLLLCAPLALAQNQTAVSGTLTDPGAVPYYPATVLACLSPSTLYPTVGGQAVNPVPGTNYCVGPVNTAPSGYFSMGLWPNSLITPASTQWVFTVVVPGPPAPSGFGNQQFSATITISGASQDVGATLNAAGVSILRSGGIATNATNLVGPGAITGTFTGTHTESGVVTFSNASSTFAGNAATATSATSATSATNATTATNLTGPGAITGTFSGSPVLSGVLSAKNIESIRFCDQFAGATADVQINAAIANLPANGGTVDCRGYGATSQTIAATVNLNNGSDSQSITLLIDRTTLFTCTITNNTPCFQVGPGSGIVASGGVVTQPNLGILLSSTAAVSNVILYKAQSPNLHSGFELDGVWISCNTASTISDAVIGLQNVLQPANLYNSYVANGCRNTILLKLYSTSGSFVTDATQIWSTGLDCAAQTGCRPVWIGCAAQGSITAIACAGVGNVSFFGGVITHPGSGGIPMVDIEASNGAAGTNVIGNINFYGVHWESSNTTDIGVLINGASEGVHVYGGYASSAAAAGADLIKIANPAGTVSDGIVIDGMDNQGGWTNCVNNTVNSKTITFAGDVCRRFNYRYNQTATTKANMWEDQTGTLVKIDGSGLTTKTLLPFTAGSSDAGSASLPFGNLWLGTAATNNFKFQPAATAGARIWSIPDWGANGSSTQNQPFVIVLTSQYTNSTTTFSNVSGGNTIQFAVAASQNYTATCHLYYQAAATGGLNIEFTGPASPTVVRYGIDLPTAITGVSSGEADAFGTSIGAVSTAGATNLDAMVSFSLINGTNAGTVNLLAKSSAAVQLQIQSGSWCRIQ